VIESLKILAMCVFAAIFYGVLHDQITTRVCLEYFTVFHPPVFPTQSVTWLAFGWGIIATWWVGAFLGILLAIAGRAGSKRKLSAAMLSKPVGKLLLTMGRGALLWFIKAIGCRGKGSYFRTNGFQPTCPRLFMPDLWPTGGRTTRPTQLESSEALRSALCSIGNACPYPKNHISGNAT